jgi:type IV pilus assembly protein PilF
MERKKMNNRCDFFWTAGIIFQQMIRAALPVIMVVVVAAGTWSCSAKNTKLAGLHLDKGVSYIQQGQYTSALRELLEAKKLNPDDHVMRYYLGIAYHGKRLIPEAVAEFKEAIQIKPDYSDAHNYLGTVYSEMGRWDEAIEEFNLAVSNILYETPSGALNNMGYAYFRKGDYQTALSKFDEAVKREPTTLLGPLIEKNRGMTFFARGQFHQAVLHLKKSLADAPDFAESRYWLARCYLELKNTNAAKEEFLAIVKIAPDSEFGIRARTALEAIATGSR